MSMRKEAMVLVLCICLAVLFVPTWTSAKTLTLPMPIMNWWDPAEFNSYETLALENVYERLLDYNNDGTFKPVLATSWERSAGGKVWTFKLRKGVKFQNGEPFNASVVKYCIERNKNAKKEMSWIWNNLEEVKVLDEYTAQFVCKIPQPIDLIAASNYCAHMYPPKLTEEKGEKWYREGNAVGTGPYKFMSWERGVQIVLEKFEGYWGGWKPNQYDRILFKWVEEPSTRVQLLKGGGIDVIEYVPVEMLPALKQDPNIEFVVTGGLRNRKYHLNTQKPPTDDLNVRKAIIHAINLNELVPSLYGERAEVSLGVVPKNMWGHKKDLKTYAYDVEKAKQLLKQSKYAAELAKGPMKLAMISYSGDSGGTAVYMQSALKKIGFDVEIDQTPWPAVADKIKKFETSPNICIQNWGPSYMTPGDWFQVVYSSEKECLWNWSRYSNPDFDKLVKEAAAMEGVDRKKAIELYEKLQQWVEDEALSIHLLDWNDLSIKRKEVKGFQHYLCYPSVFFAYSLYY